ncbi:unnamed protein product [Schistosoma margrebowiei]|uniref:Uncharacterized protein n=1 Tax=Schistosoma margrebowiei TaxID=48269 RepID=A0A183MF19_9TREM|nr:unnamed protein product [Schistosoma margrebowiei]
MGLVSWMYLHSRVHVHSRNLTQYRSIISGGNPLAKILIDAS